MTDVALQFAPGSFDKLRRSVEKRSRLLNEDIRKTLIKTSVKILTALRASAKVSPAKRDLYEARAMSLDTRFKHTRMQNKIQDWYKTHGPARNKTGRQLPPSVYTKKGERTGDFKFAAIKRRYAGEYKLFPMNGVEKEAVAKKSTKLIIKKRGIAKSSFTWMMGKLGAGGSAQQKEEPGATSVQKSSRTEGNSTVLSINLLNQIKYILTALRGGKKDAFSALQRARSMLVYDTKRALKARFK